MGGANARRRQTLPLPSAKNRPTVLGKADAGRIATMQDISSLELQVVLPVYNESSNIGTVIDQWCAQFDSGGIRYAILAIDDGSKDDTAAVLQALQQKWGAKLEVVRQQNSGHGPTILKGYRMATERGVPWIFQIDSDGQCDPRYFAQFWMGREKFDFIAGRRTRREDGIGRVFVSLVLRLAVLLIARQNCRDVNVPYRLMRTSAIAPLVQRIPEKCFFTNVGLTVLALRAGLRFKLIPIVFRARAGGKTTVPYRKMGTHALNLYRNLRELLQS
jgi:dolichol-phosphate mannosyltransferase